MALAHFQRTFTDASGNIKPGLSVTVRRESDNGLAALFADAGSVTPKSNPFNTDANGYGSFYAVNERYRIQATDIDWRDEDLISQPDLAASLAAISTNTSDILERAELSGGPLANFTAMPQVGGDPIVESGSNADGEWTRWSDGTQTAWFTYDAAFTADAGNERSSGVYSSASANSDDYEWSYPASFLAKPSTSAQCNSILNSANTYSVGATIAGVGIIGFNGAVTGATISASAIGRWQ